MLTAAERFIRAKGAANVVFQEADAMALPFADGEFDLVTCRIAPHHFPDCAQFVRETARVLRPGGVAAIIDNVVPDDAGAAQHINALEKLRDPSHNWAYTASDWLGFCAAAGLTVTHSEIFVKTRDLDEWCDRMAVEAKRREQVRVLIWQAPAAARAALAPRQVGSALKFLLTEVMVIAQKPAD
jgi:SAM-dependent methyltransferase